jgi:putative spermidine/putrescine transport system permease protein
MPTFLGAMILLFGNAFGAYATSYAFSGASLTLVPIVIGGQIAGDVLFNPGLGNALAMGMIIIMSLSLVGYSQMMRRASRWMR